MKYINEEIEHIASDLRLSGFFMFSPTSNFAETMNLELLREFKNLLHVQIDEWKAFFITNEHGKIRVVRIIDDLVYNNKRNLDWYAGRKIPELDSYVIEIKRLKNLRSMIEKHKF